MTPLDYSAPARRSIALLYRPYNDVEVYIEDATAEELFRQILLKILPVGIRVQRVVGLGGKDRVLDELARPSSDPKPPKFYILDGDLDRLLGMRQALPRCAFMLPEYCIENHLLKEAAVCDVTHDQYCRTSREDVAAQVAFDSWLRQAVTVLSPLFAVFAFLRDTDQPPRTEGAVYRLACDNRGQLDPGKVRNSVAQLRAAALQRDPDALCKIEALSRRMGRSWRQRKRHVSGKFLLVCLLGRINRLLPRHRLSLEPFRFRLAKRSEYPELSPLVRAVLRTLRHGAHTS